MPIKRLVANLSDALPRLGGVMLIAFNVFPHQPARQGKETQPCFRVCIVHS